jgi:anti-sigma B factor antagonist
MLYQSRTVGNVQVLAFSGSLDAYHAPQARQLLDQALEQEPANLVVNLREVNFLDSTGLSTLVQGMKRSRLTKGDLCLCGLQQPVRMIFELTRLDSVFEIFNSEEEAVQALASK